MKENNEKNSYLNKVFIMSIICIFCGKYLPQKYLLALVVCLTAVFLFTFINAIIKKKDVIHNKYFYHFCISSFLGMLLLALYLSSKVVLNWSEAVQIDLLILMIISFVYFLAVGLIMMFHSSNKDMIKLAKMVLILFSLSALIIVAIIIFTILNK